MEGPSDPPVGHRYLVGPHVPLNPDHQAALHPGPGHWFDLAMLGVEVVCRPGVTSRGSGTVARLRSRVGEDSIESCASDIENGDQGVLLSAPSVGTRGELGQRMNLSIFT